MATSEKALTIIHILSPILVLLYYLTTSVLLAVKPAEDHYPAKGRNFQQLLDLVLTGITGLLYIAESIFIASAPLRYTVGVTTNFDLYFTLYSTLAWLAIFLGSVTAGNGAKKYNFQGAWIISFCFEVLVLGFSSTRPHLSGTARAAQIVFQTARLISISSLIGSNIVINNWNKREQASDEEVAPLLQSAAVNLRSGENPVTGEVCGTNQSKHQIESSSTNSSVNGESGPNGINDENGDDDDDDDELTAAAKLKQNWWQYLKAFGVFLPYIWPTNNIRLQLRLVGLMFCLLLERSLNVMVPIALGEAINAFNSAAGEMTIPWRQLAFYIVFGLVNTRAGIGMWKSLLWYSVSLHSTFRLKTAAYDHLMALSSDFHDSKKSGIIHQTLQRGTSVVALFRTITVELIPMAADLFIAISVFCLMFDAYMGFIVATSAVLFWWSAVSSASRYVKLRRRFIKDWENEWYQMSESTGNWSTVSHFGRHPYEQDRYRNCVSATQATGYQQYLFSQIIEMVKTAVLKLGLLGACLLVSYQIVYEQRPVGDFVVLITYWGGLSSPLEYFATGFTDIAEYLVDAEKLRALLEKKPTVQDLPAAPDFEFKEGAVEFQNVTFSYDGNRKVSSQINFQVKPGETVALVGETGSGKSTLLKLLFRFYDPTKGRILVDGQDIRKVNLASYRAHIGVVPQDPILFNMSVLENLRYPDLEATEEQVQDACKAVALHEKIMTFSKGYDEIVGERGVKLSGGEMQRVAIARAMLKNPQILLLDEATSSVDTKTELKIQKSLAELSSNRTTFVIAHRLSTIISADKILVIKDGEISEAGSHAELMKRRGPYHELWTSQKYAFLGIELDKSN
jgi:ABC-type multidrug transport system fused ATPase/permease subunit